MTIIVSLVAVSFEASAQERAPKDVIINEVLFSIGSESYTARDMMIYKAVLNELFQKSRISQFTKKPFDDFLLSRLSYKEAKAFELTNEKNKLSDAVKNKLKEFSPEEISSENEVLSVALSLIEIKEVQLKNQARFDTWFELLKRKYQLKVKSNEFK